MPLSRDVASRVAIKDLKMIVIERLISSTRFLSNELDNIMSSWVQLCPLTTLQTSSSTSNRLLKSCCSLERQISFISNTRSSITFYLKRVKLQQPVSRWSILHGKDPAMIPYQQKQNHEEGRGGWTSVINPWGETFFLFRSCLYSPIRITDKVKASQWAIRTPSDYITISVYKCQISCRFLGPNWDWMFLFVNILSDKTKLS